MLRLGGRSRAPAQRLRSTWGRGPSRSCVVHCSKRAWRRTHLCTCVGAQPVRKAGSSSSGCGTASPTPVRCRRRRSSWSAATASPATPTPSDRYSKKPCSACAEGRAALSAATALHIIGRRTYDGDGIGSVFTCAWRSMTSLGFPLPGAFSTRKRFVRPLHSEATRLRVFLEAAILSAS
jgi:hypothetical protein